jgi:hypothetical protein
MQGMLGVVVTREEFEKGLIRASGGTAWESLSDDETSEIEMTREYSLVISISEVSSSLRLSHAVPPEARISPFSNSSRVTTTPSMPCMLFSGLTQ